MIELEGCNGEWRGREWWLLRKKRGAPEALEEVYVGIFFI
jgi:hypothetical protein